MLTRGQISRRATDLMVIATVYAIVLIGSFMYVRGSMRAQPGFPNLQAGATAILLAVTPTIVLVVLVISGIRFTREYRRKAWGHRLRARVIAAFILVALMSAIPPSILLGSLAIRAFEAPSSAAVRAALKTGLDQALALYAGMEADLKYTAENDVPSYLAGRNPDAERLLARLQARNSSICAVELFAGGASVSFSGDTYTRAAKSYVAMDRNGFLPRLSTGGRSYARYFARDVGSSTENGPLSVVVSLAFPEEVEDAAARMSSALAAIDRSAPGAASFIVYVAYFTASFVFPLTAMAILFALEASDRLLHPVAALSDAIRRIGAGARRAPFIAKPGDEAGDIVEELNALLDSLERARGNEIRNEKIGAWRDIARKLAHELRNPLTPIRLSAERVLKRWKADPSGAGDIIEKSMVAIVQETVNMESLLTEFRDFARLPEPQKDWMEVKPMIDEAVHLYSASLPSMAIDCDGVDPGIVLKADRGYLKQAIGNLLANAGDATNGKGNVWIRADLVKTAESRYCRIQVRDDGCGIPPEDRDKVFSPYFTTKQGGTGLGLAIVEHIVAAHGGKIRFESSEGAGTIFYIDVPAENA
jgi:nitrogen fixation/metabolism regulation signal transduction histidine kinase